jgi:hypothetical protein
MTEKEKIIQRIIELGKESQGQDFTRANITFFTFDISEEDYNWILKHSSNERLLINLKASIEEEEYETAIVIKNELDSRNVIIPDNILDF